jgi:hypothetical protein
MSAASAGAPSKRINRALQGGAHGALTWGCPNRLLEDERISDCRHGHARVDNSRAATSRVTGKLA